MTSKELTAKELIECQFSSYKDRENANIISKRMEGGEKIIARRVITGAGHRVDIYIYDLNLHRYIKTDSFHLYF